MRASSAGDTGITVASSPYRWPYTGQLDIAVLAVVVTGAQPWFLGRSSGGQEALERSRRCADAARGLGAVVVWVTHTRPHLRRRSPAHLPTPGSPAATLAVEPGPGDLVVSSCGIDGFYASPLDELLRSTGRTHLVLGGCTLETTVHSTLRSANDRGYECLTLLDATARSRPDLSEGAESSICMSGGIFGAVARSADLIAAFDQIQPCHSLIRHSLEEHACAFPS